jgi:hypothetical protein
MFDLRLQLSQENSWAVKGVLLVKYLVSWTSAHPREWNVSGRCVNGCSPQQGPPRTPDFKITDFCLLGHMTDLIYKLKAATRYPLLRHTLDSCEGIFSKTLVRNVPGWTRSLGVGMSNIHCKYAVYINIVSTILIHCIIQLITHL